ncbi:Lysophospholipid acyltransferase 1 [Desmophyllum pertusum]|uniref:Lysophospholipid acyltransferase 1 n=1 Tax=Desmophyllum pertusum TaxID=174260 RepID=A0A9X0CL41_9CNID|nr:Lysophospholipid acyltransferase 1 [Desmophyllum pertusum]
MANLHLLGFCGICYILMWLLNPAVVHKYVLAVSMGFLSVAHLHRQITDYGGYTMDFTGPLMILVQRITYVAFSVHDGLARDESKLTDEQGKKDSRKFHLCWNISVTYIRPKDPGQKEPSPMNAVVRNLTACLVCITVLLLTGSNYPIARNGDPEFTRSHHLIWRITYSWISIVSIRMRYYFAFKLAEAVNNMCGLGFNGYDENGKAKWDRVTNVNILKLEFASNMKEVLDNWNICTVVWLRRIVYDRVPHHRTQAVFVLSALWHGFYTGYYMAFTTCGLMVEAARKVRRTCRPSFQGSRVSSLVYDVTTCAVTMFCLTFTTVPFVALEFRIGLQYWSSMYYFGHVWCLVPLLLLNGGKPKRQQKSKENTQVKSEEKDEHNNTTTDDFTEIRNRCNKKLESQNEPRNLFYTGTYTSLLKKENIMWFLRAVYYR